jgi:factor associated with neutral sphingomyelinase activation
MSLEKSLHADQVTSILLISTENVATMKENGRIGPYRQHHATSAQPFVLYFALKYLNEPLKSVSDRINALMVALTKSVVERRQTTASLVKSYQHFFQRPFDPNWLEFKEAIELQVNGGRVVPLISYHGRIVVTQHRVLFQPFSNFGREPYEAYSLSSIIRVLPRFYNLRPHGAELYFEDDQSVFFNFNGIEDRRAFLESLNGLCIADVPLDDALPMKEIEECTQRWLRHELTNYDYLMLINGYANRTTNDPSQYPVFPWIIKDYESNVLDLTKPSTFRDLSLPVGALNESRFRTYLERYHEMPEPKFLYGTHYSTPAYVLYFLVRLCPEYMLCLQNGKFDAPDRLFFAVGHTWRGVSSNQADVKELIPEFYQKPATIDLDFLINTQRLDLGVRQDGQRVDDVLLPPWAKTAADFHRICAEALECEYVSQHLHHWIDLIFGFKQRGEEAFKAKNVFHPMSLWGGHVDLDALPEEERLAIEVQVREFGQSPRQIWTTPHPQRLPKDVVLHEDMGKMEIVERTINAQPEERQTKLQLEVVKSSIAVHREYAPRL